MVNMIRLGAEYLARIYPPGSPQMRQLEFVARSFGNLPVEVVNEYRSLCEGTAQSGVASAGTVGLDDDAGADRAVNFHTSWLGRAGRCGAPLFAIRRRAR
jgi:hypothetical protein